MGNFDAIKECDKLYNTIISDMEYINQISEKILNEKVFNIKERSDEELFILAYEYQSTCTDYMRRNHA